MVKSQEYKVIVITDDNVIKGFNEMVSNGKSNWPCEFSNVKKDLLTQLYWLIECCLHHIHTHNNQKIVLTLMRYYKALSDIAIVYYSNKIAINSADGEAANRIRKAVNALIDLGLDFESDIAIAKVLNSGVVTTGKVASVNVVDSDPWD